MEDAYHSSMELRSSPPPFLAPAAPRHRKRTRSSVHDDDSTPSDGPLFSSDPPDPSVDQYFQPQKKRQYRGTWWGEVTQDPPVEPTQQRTKSGFSRNMDSGIWMGSDNTEGSFGSDDTVPDENLPQRVAAKLEGSLTRIIYPIQRIARTPSEFLARTLPPLEPPSITKARAVVQDCLENNTEHVRLLGLGLNYLTDDLLTPLHTLVRDRDSFKPWNVEFKRADRKERDTGLVPQIKLHLERNALKTLPISLFALQNITTLDISNNNLIHLSPHIGKLSNLSSLNIKSNRLRCLPWELIQLFRIGRLEDIRFDENPFFQPFSYVGPWYLPFYPSFTRPTLEFTPESWYAPETIKGLLQRLEEADRTLGYLQNAKSRGLALQDLDDVSESDQRTLDQAIEHAKWMRHFYTGYAVKPLLLSTPFSDAVHGKIDPLNLVRSSDSGNDGDIRLFEEQESEQEATLDTARKRVGAVHVASTPVHRFRIDGSSLGSPRNPAPSLLPDDELLLAGILGNNYFSYSKVDFELPKPDLVFTERIISHLLADEATNDDESTFERSAAPSLFDLALQSATKASEHELSSLPSMLPEDAPDSVIRGLNTAIDAHKEGGRTCSVCSRLYVIPRTEWVEYWHIVKRSSMTPKTGLFVPVLRRGCSVKCVPGRNRDEEDMRVNLLAPERAH